MSSDINRAMMLRDRSYFTLDEAELIVRKLTAADIVLTLPEIRERMMEMTIACEAFTRAWNQYQQDKTVARINALKTEIEEDQ